MTIQTPAHLARFNGDRAQRIGASNDAIRQSEAAGQVAGQAQYDRIVAQAKLLRDRMIFDGNQEKKELIREAEVEARKILRSANDILASAERKKQTAVKKIERAQARAAEIRESAYEQKRSIILAAKNCTRDIQEMYQTVLEDTDRIRKESRRETHVECQAMRLSAERDSKLIREKARNEGLAMADLEIRDRAHRELISSQSQGARRG